MHSYGLISKFRTPQVYMNLNKNIYNPLPGSALGIPLNLMQFIFTTAHYNEVIITKELIILQFCLGFFTYGSDRLFDAYDYYSNNNNNTQITTSKEKMYKYLIDYNKSFIISLLIAYSYIFNQLSENIDTIPFILLLLSTLFYKDFKTQFGQYKALYIASFWSISSIILPCVLYDNNYSILLDPYSYLPCFFTLFASSNLLDIKDINEDTQNNIMTIPVLYGEINSILISYISTILSIIIFLKNPNFKTNIIPNIIFELQNIGSFIIPFSYNLTNI